MTDRGRFHAAATHQKAIAESYETDLVDYDKAMKAYEVAADWLLGEEAKAQANQCLLKVATFAGQLEQYDKAIEKFEYVGMASLENNLTKWSAREYFFKAALCHMCVDLVGARRAVDKYSSMDATFPTTREYDLVTKLLGDLEAADVDAFTQHVVEFDNLTKLDSWKTTILLRVKKTIAEEMSIT